MAFYEKMPSDIFDESKSLEDTDLLRSDSRGNNPNQNSNYVRLNVGGVYFETTKTTLLTEPDSIFHALLSERFPLTFDDQGRVFLDRDGTPHLPNSPRNKL